MLEIVIPGIEEGWDEEKQEFITVKAQTLQLEHSLISLSKWESKWCKSFLSKTNKKTTEEELDYVRCMTLTPNVDPKVYERLTMDNMQKIVEYIEAPMTAVYFPENNSGPMNKDVVTSDLIYYWMVTLNIPFECVKWHLNRLLALIRVCNIKNQPPNKRRSPQAIGSRNAAINAARRKRLNSKG